MKAVYLELDKTNECIEMCENAIKLGRAHNAECTLIARLDFFYVSFYEIMKFLREIFFK